MKDYNAVAGLLLLDKKLSGGELSVSCVRTYREDGSR